MRAVLGAWVIAALLWSSRAAADDDFDAQGADDSQVATFELGLGGHVGYGNGNACARIASDVIGCQSGHSFAGLTLAPRWRLDPAWSLGATGAVSWASAISDTQSRTMWNAALAARWHPQRGAGIDTWMGVDTGVVVLVDELEADELGPARSYSSGAPALGAAFGIAVPLASALALGFDLRGFLHLFGGDAEATAPDYESEAGLMLGMSAIVLAGR